MKQGFSACHPAVILLFFLSIMTVSLSFSHPLCRLISLAAACGYSIRLEGKKALLFQLKMVLPLMFLTMVLNPMFSHEGVTILAYLPTGNPLTLESMLYGLSMSVMLASLICWCFCFHRVMTSDQFTYLFSRVSPALSILLTMTLRFVPRFQRQFHEVTLAQRNLGKASETGGLFHRVKRAGHVLSTMVSWSLENGVQVSDSMKSRGYGESPRTSYSIYRVSRRDQWALAALAGLSFFVIFLQWRGVLSFRYYPAIKTPGYSLWALTAFLCVGALGCVPMLIDGWEERTWRSITWKT